MPVMVSLTCSSPLILDKTQTRLFSKYRFLVKSLINKNYHNARTSNDIDLKLESLSKLEKIKTATSKNLMVTTCQQIMVSS